MAGERQRRRAEEILGANPLTTEALKPPPPPPPVVVRAPLPRELEPLAVPVRQVVQAAAAPPVTREERGETERLARAIILPVFDAFRNSNPEIATRLRRDGYQLNDMLGG